MERDRLLHELKEKKHKVMERFGLPEEASEEVDGTLEWLDTEELQELQRQLDAHPTYKGLKRWAHAGQHLLFPSP